MSYWHLQLASKALEKGGIVAYPTEGVYGLGCDPLNATAVIKLLELKRRSINKGLILIAANIDQLLPYIHNNKKEVLDKVTASWPGPTTWLLPADKNTPYWLTGDKSTIAVRVTAHPVAAGLCNAFGSAIVSTSANISGRPAARHALKVRDFFGDSVSYILSGKIDLHNKPSEIRDATSNRIIRQR